MAKQNMSKKGLARFHRKKLPKDAVRKNQHLRQQQLQRALDKQHGAAGAGAKKQPAQGGKLKSGALPLAFAAGKRVLLLGEGNLSFAAALVSLFGGHGHGVVATTYDTESEMREKYGSGSAAAASALVSSGAVVGYGIDATDLVRCLKALRKRVASRGVHESDEVEAAEEQSTRPSVPPLFDRIVFNFPHRGAGIKDQDANVQTNQELLVAFFAECPALLAPQGEILVTLKTGAPYHLWNVPRLASQGSRNALRLHTAIPFDAAQFPGYAHRHTHGDSVSRPNAEELAGGARTYIWRVLPS